jgi:hypothetical protein
MRNDARRRPSGTQGRKPTLLGQHCAETAGLRPHNILWASIVVSALVAAFTALVIKYLAKPQLEVRKERILERSRLKRSALKGLLTADYTIGRIIGLRDDQSIDVFRDQTIRMAEKVEPLIEAAYEELEAPASIADDWLNSTAAVASFLIGIRVSLPPKETTWDWFDTVSDHLEQYAVLFCTPRWHWWQRRKLVHKIGLSRLPEPPRLGAPAAEAP